MGIDNLVAIIHSSDSAAWTERNRDAFGELFGAETGRYPAAAGKTFAVRAPAMSSDAGVPFAAYIHPANPPSGAYGGMSFVIFPVSGEPCLVGLGVGTQGLAPDAAILGKPGHARKAQAICAWLNKAFGQGGQIAWAKHDPTRTDVSIPDELRKKWSAYKSVFDRYGREMYALFKPTSGTEVTTEAVTALLDLVLAERGFEPLTKYQVDGERVRAAWFKHLMPDLDRDHLKNLLDDRRFVILQGPPGTGKTRMATELLQDEYHGRGRSVQFHPNTTYETFVGGLSPVQSTADLGLQFRPIPGFLMEAAVEARKGISKPYLLHIDEINRADLSKILGEAIFLFEPRESKRQIGLQYVFPEPICRTLSLPENLHILGTMNTADRSIAIVDVAVRRRFAFVSLWPQDESRGRVWVRFDPTSVPRDCINLHRACDRGRVQSSARALLLPRIRRFQSETKSKDRSRAPFGRVSRAGLHWRIRRTNSELSPVAAQPLGRRDRGKTRWRSRTPLIVKPAEDICLELQDHSTLHKSAVEFFHLEGMRDPNSQAARFAEQFENENRSLFSLLDVGIDRLFDGNDVVMRIQAGGTVGALPLFSPTRATPDYGIVVQPRFPWTGIGPMLAQMGWRIAPTPLKLPLLKRSERRVPPWVISFMVMSRLRALLDSLTRRFEVVRERRSAPHGTVHWDDYACRHIPRGDFAGLPCTFPDLQDDRLLKGAIRFTLERHLRALQSQKEHGSYVHKLIELCQQLLLRVQATKVYLPNPATLRAWQERPMKSEYLAEGLQAIEWTVEDRGLAGTSDLEGIPWIMPMEDFFEAWIETVFQDVARNTGAVLKTGRKRETVHPIAWDPPYLGSQKSLVPDVWLEWDSTTLIVDAKYNRHWQEFQQHSWFEVEDQLREQHRNDLLQVLAYGNLAHTQRVIACLAYPCSPESWAHLLEKKQLVHQAEIAVGSRSLYLWLTAVPMGSPIEEVGQPLESQVRALLSNAV